jgi:Xaa-Pro aminopeptidase
LTRDAAIAAPAYRQRLAALRQSFGECGVDALLVTHPANLRYLVSFDGSMGALLLSEKGSSLIVDGRYLTSARERLAGFDDLRRIDIELADGSLEESIAEIVLKGPRISNLGVEAAAISLSRFNRLSEALGRAAAGIPGAIAPRLQATEGLVEQRRIVKDAMEIAILREAARRLSAVAREVLRASVRVGRSERDIAGDIDAALRRAGFERPAFETVVASGPNGALPHARPTGRTLEGSDGVLLDFGGIYDGYCVDLSRTVQLSPETDEFGRLLDAVRAAHAAAILAVAPGVRASAVDSAARDALGRFGFRDAFVHGTGHGLGLEVHEGPRLAKAGSALTDQLLQPGMVFTIEPGAYVPGLGGARIEDDVLLTETGCEVLTDVPIDRTCGAR